MAPTLIDSAAYWTSDTPSVFLLRFVKNLEGVEAAGTGTWVSMTKIVNNLKRGYEREENREHSHYYRIYV